MTMTAGTTRSADTILNEEFLETRSRLLDIAASLDRIDRGGSQCSDPRLGQLRQALEILLEAREGRAEQLQQLFSRDYDAQWMEAYGLKQ